MTSNATPQTDTADSSMRHDSVAVLDPDDRFAIRNSVEGGSSEPTAEEKLRLVIAVLGRRVSLLDAARAADVGEFAISIWLRGFIEAGEDGLRANEPHFNGASYPDLLAGNDALKERIREMRSRIQRLKSSTQAVPGPSAASR
jgi:transposase-like protein